jgi:transposase-like protein
VTDSLGIPNAIMGFVEVRPDCEVCKGTGRVRSGPIPQRAQGYLETVCHACYDATTQSMFKDSFRLGAAPTSEAVATEEPADS